MVKFLLNEITADSETKNRSIMNQNISYHKKVKLSIKNLIIGNIISLLWCMACFSQPIDLKGQLSGWLVIDDSVFTETKFGIRYVPGLSLKKSITNKHAFDLELSLNTYRSGQVHVMKNIKLTGKTKPYRLWLRYSMPQFEVRLGLQKINFGSATLLRSLMWFDRIDPRDPLQITDGVYGLLFRYYFLNNVNIWLWGLYGNDELKGWEMFPSHKDLPEYGGRIQLPFYDGEVAFSYHHRQMDLSNFPAAPYLPVNKTVPENRFALDGKWDFGIGLWFESVLIYQQSELLFLDYQKLLNFGLDYTFSVGNGLHVLGEQLFIEKSDKIFCNGEQANFSAILADYPLGLIDQVMSIFYYDWENQNLYRFLSWQRIYDNWIFYLFGFWNPEQNQLYQNQTGSNPFAGKGFQVMVVFNH